MQEVPALGDLSESPVYLENAHTAYFIGMLGGAEEVKHRKACDLSAHESCGHISFLPLDRRLLKIGSNLFPFRFPLYDTSSEKSQGYCRGQILAPQDPPSLGEGGQCSLAEDFTWSVPPGVKSAEGLSCWHPGRRHRWASHGHLWGSGTHRCQLDFWSMALGSTFKALLG